MEKRVIIPAAMLLNLDDVMWHKGHDLRWRGQASRTEIARMHVPEDYEIIHQLGKALDMKINCPICLGDWDKDNFLTGVVGPTHDPKGWNRKDEIDLELSRKYFDAAEGSPYIEYAYHGLLHGLYDENGARLNEWEYFKTDDGGDPVMLPNEELVLHFDLFDKIYNSWGFKKQIRTFCPPSGIPLKNKEDWSEIERLSSILYDRGVRYIMARWQKVTECSRLCSGILYMEKNVRFGISSAACDVDPRYIPNFAEDGDENFGDILGMHWTNFIHYYPQNNLERLGQWIAWFKRQAEVFGLMLSRDIAFTANQCIYRKNSEIRMEADGCVIDVSVAQGLGFSELGDIFYVSFKNDSLPKNCIGGAMELYESHNNFKTYKVKVLNPIIKFLI